MKRHLLALGEKLDWHFAAHPAWLVAAAHCQAPRPGLLGQLLFQAGAQVAQMPQIAPVADAIMSGAGYTRPTSSNDPNFPTAEIVPTMPPQGPGPLPGVQANTSPAFPPVPDDGASPMTGIETADVGDNLEGMQP